MPRHLITSALPYINGVKHLGNLIGSMLPADVYARFLRARGEDVLYICATDEHGTPAELAALGEGIDVAEYCTIQHERQAGLYARYALSFDHFGRTSSPQNRTLTQHFAARLEANGFLEERETVQLYSHHDDRYLPDRYVLGTCPYCGFTSARGDQCDQCAHVLDPGDLIEPRSAISGSEELELRSTHHLFLRLDALAGEVGDWLSSKRNWPVLVTSIAQKWLDEGLKPRSITRDLDWGVPVDRPGFEDKVYYVWFDAPIGYIGATAEWAELDPARDWRSWWTSGEDIVYTQFMAKDNIPFHTVFFPATIIGAREDWVLADYIKGFNWLNFYGGKFSTSRNFGVFLDDALELRDADYWRWYLLSNAPESDDSSFTFERFAESVNSDLANTLGNLVNRAVTFTERQFGPMVPEGGTPGTNESDLHDELHALGTRYTEHLEALEFRKATAALREIWTLGNRYLELCEPWRSIKSDRDAAAVCLRTAINLLCHVSTLTMPMLPGTAATIREALGLDGEPGWPVSADDYRLDVVAGAHPISSPGILFQKVTPDEVEAWTERFASGLTDDSPG